MILNWDSKLNFLCRFKIVHCNSSVVIFFDIFKSESHNDFLVL